jgi:hypothetical protein
MKTRIWELTLNKKLGLTAGLLGFIALFLGNPYQGSGATVNVKELAISVEREVDHVSPEELAEWIMQGKADFTLVDIRSEKEYAEYHIPGAENIPLAVLPNAELRRNEKIVLYSEGGIHSVQAWFFLKAKNYKGVYILKEGLDGWKDKILFPTLADNATPFEKAAFEKTKAVSRFFGGTPLSGGGEKEVRPRISMPQLDAPASPGTQTGAQKKKKKEGC